MKKLHLVLKKKWFDMIASGEKKEEYREAKPYWVNKFPMSRLDAEGFPHCDKYSSVVFHCGYTSQTIEYSIKDITIGIGRTEWGAELFTNYFIIILGDKIA